MGCACLSVTPGMSWKPKVCGTPRYQLSWLTEWELLQMFAESPLSADWIYPSRKGDTS